MDKVFLNNQLIIQVAWNFTSKFENGEQLLINCDAMAKAMASLIGSPVHSADGTVIGKCIDYYQPYEKIPHFILAMHIDNKFKDFILKNHSGLTIGTSRSSDEKNQEIK